MSGEDAFGVRFRESQEESLESGHGEVSMCHLLADPKSQ